MKPFWPMLVVFLGIPSVVLLSVALTEIPRATVQDAVNLQRLNTAMQTTYADIDDATAEWRRRQNQKLAAQPVPGRQVPPYPSLPAEASAPTLTMERLTQIGEHTQTYIVHDTQEHQCALVIRDVSPVGNLRDPHWNVSITALPWACAEVRK